MYTLSQFRNLTKGLPGDFEIRIEALFMSEGNATAPCFEIVTSKKSKGSCFNAGGGTYK